MELQTIHVELAACATRRRGIGISTHFYPEGVLPRVINGDVLMRLKQP